MASSPFVRVDLIKLWSGAAESLSKNGMQKCPQLTFLKTPRNGLKGHNIRYGRLIKGHRRRWWNQASLPAGQRLLTTILDWQ
jgi:hypothetical protein